MVTELGPPGGAVLVRHSPGFSDAKWAYEHLDREIAHCRPRCVRALAHPRDPPEHARFWLVYANRRGLPFERLAGWDRADEVGRKAFVFVLRGRAAELELADWLRAGGARTEVHHALWSRRVFVYGSNLAGINGSGAAKYAAEHWGARPLGEGRQYQSYALPTKIGPYRNRPFVDIASSAERFLAHARSNPDDLFLLTKVGTGRAGHPQARVSALFAEAPANVVLIDDHGVQIGPASDWHAMSGGLA